MLPHWEKWSDEDPSVHRLLECNSADPHTYDTYFQRIIRTTHALGRQRNGASAHAALAAAAVCVNAYTGVPAVRFETACERAFAADKAAMLAALS